MIGASDEQAHEPAESEHAQESWYFNWTDPRHRFFGLARIGYRYHARQPEPLILTIRDGAPEFIFPLTPVPPMQGTWRDLDPAAGLRAGDLLVEMLEPLRRWRVRLDGEDRLDLCFEAFTPPFDYAAHGAELASTMTTAHFEQSCRVTGWTELRGQRLEIDGLGQRDKSWGVRVWPDIDGWDWICAQLGTDLSFNLMRTREKGAAFDNGFVFHDGRNLAIREAELRYTWGSRPHAPATADLELVDESGARHRLAARIHGIFPIPRDAVRLEECHATFRYRGPAGEREGDGVVEHVWRADVS